MLDRQQGLISESLEPGNIMQVYFILGTYSYLSQKPIPLQSRNDAVLLLGRPTIPWIYRETLGVTSHLSCGRLPPWQFQK